MRKLKQGEVIGLSTALVLIVFFFVIAQPSSIFNISFPNTTVDTDDGTPSGLLTEDVVIGTGAEAVSGTVVSVHYTGYLTDGTVFDSSVNRGTPFQFLLGSGQVIPGWDQGLQGMKEGGQRRLVIPPELAYGEQGYGPIPGNATLLFEVELLSVETPQ